MTVDFCGNFCVFKLQIFESSYVQGPSEHSDLPRSSYNKNTNL